MDPRRRIDEITGHHALFFGTDVDGSFAAEHPRTSLETCEPRLLGEGGNRLRELQCSPYAPFRIVLARDGRPPYGHDCVSDELLD